MSGFLRPNLKEATEKVGVADVTDIHENRPVDGWIDLHIAGKQNKTSWGETRRTYYRALPRGTAHFCLPRTQERAKAHKSEDLYSGDAVSSDTYLRDNRDSKRIQVTFTGRQWSLIRKFQGELGMTDAEIVRNIVIAWLSEKSFISTIIKKERMG